MSIPFTICPECNTESGTLVIGGTTHCENCGQFATDVVVVSTIPAPGTIGIGVGIQYDPIEERGETLESAFHSIVWFPADKKEAAEEFAATTDGWVVREGIAL